MPVVLERELGRGGDLLTSATARAAALARASERCGCVLSPRRVWRRSDGVVAVTFPVAAGVSLAELGAAGSLTVGQCVTVGVGVAEALAAMHGERVAHGDVSAANVVVDGRRVTLVDTMGALSGERGTRGFAAPERHDGATPAGDVFALGMLLRSLAGIEAEPVIEAWTGPLLVAEPRDRPIARHAAAALARCAPREPIRPPDAAVAAAIRAGAVERTQRRPADRWWHLERTALRSVPFVALAVGATFSGLALVPSVATMPDAPVTDAPHVTPQVVPIAEAVHDDPVEAAVALAESRIAALADGDADALVAVSVSGSAAAQADRELAAAVDAGTADFAGLELLDASARLVRAIPGGAVVEVTSTLSGYGVGQAAVPGGTATATLQIALTQQGWRVARILPPP